MCEGAKIIADAIGSAALSITIIIWVSAVYLAFKMERARRAAGKQEDAA